MRNAVSPWIPRFLGQERPLIGEHCTVRNRPIGCHQGRRNACLVALPVNILKMKGLSFVQAGKPVVPASIVGSRFAKRRLQSGRDQASKPISFRVDYL
ncbi:MAG: hypothetical protein D6741_12485 [Planctomycetota bacterium]|nr:MAG: hypothetical protein D6741_12485 [Planctomycetota bacterium]